MIGKNAESAQKSNLFSKKRKFDIKKQIIYFLFSVRGEDFSKKNVSNHTNDKIVKPIQMAYILLFLIEFVWFETQTK